MKYLFNFLYEIHPWLPATYIALLANGLLFPMIYSLRKGKSFDISMIFDDARRRIVFAQYSLFAYALLVLVTVFCAVGMIFQ